jgi:hypothetical protein
VVTNMYGKMMKGKAPKAKPKAKIKKMGKKK